MKALRPRSETFVAGDQKKGSFEKRGDPRQIGDRYAL